LINIGSI